MSYYLREFQQWRESLEHLEREVLSAVVQRNEGSKTRIRGQLSMRRRLDLLLEMLDEHWNQNAPLDDDQWKEILYLIANLPLDDQYFLLHGIFADKLSESDLRKTLALATEEDQATISSAVEYFVRLNTTASTWSKENLKHVQRVHGS